MLEKIFCERQLLKFEGIESKGEDYQRKSVINQLIEYTSDNLLNDYSCDDWRKVFKAIFKYTREGAWTIYFEEVQWLANYKDNFIAELKYYWDNFFSGNDRLLIILCGSSPSFMINHVMNSKALYNRSQYELPLKPLDLEAAHQLLGKSRSLNEVMDAYLTLGGIPEYLNRINKESSLLLGICSQSFSSLGFFFKEIDRIFVSSFSESGHYKKTVDFLSKRKQSSREEILKHLGIKSSGNFSDIIQDLKLCGFIETYSSVHREAKTRSLTYQIADNYLSFYYHFIKPLEDRISTSDFDITPHLALNDESYRKWLGWSFKDFVEEIQI